MDEIIQEALFNIMMMQIMILQSMVIVWFHIITQVDEIIQEALFKADKEDAQMTALRGFVDLQVMMIIRMIMIIKMIMMMLIMMITMMMTHSNVLR